MRFQWKSENDFKQFQHCVCMSFYLVTWSRLHLLLLLLRTTTTVQQQHSRHTFNKVLMYLLCDLETQTYSVRFFGTHGVSVRACSWYMLYKNALAMTLLPNIHWNSPITITRSRSSCFHDTAVTAVFLKWELLKTLAIGAFSILEEKNCIKLSIKILADGIKVLWARTWIAHLFAVIKSQQESKCCVHAMIHLFLFDMICFLLLFFCCVYVIFKLCH